MIIDVVSDMVCPWCFLGGEYLFAALALVPEIRKFGTIIWPRWRHLDAPPPQASALRAALFAAFKNGPPPASATGLHAVCNLL